MTLNKQAFPLTRDFGCANVDFFLLKTNREN
jgi:hypothetical protein